MARLVGKGIKHSACKGLILYLQSLQPMSVYYSLLQKFRATSIIVIFSFLLSSLQSNIEKHSRESHDVVQLVIKQMVVSKGFEYHARS